MTTPMNFESVESTLKHANARVAKLYPGDSPDRQPVHTVYGGAQLFKAETTTRIGEIALKTLQEYAPNAEVFAKALGIQSTSAEFENKVYQRVIEKLKSEAVEDFRIDFEDGYGSRPDEEEDHHAALAATETARAFSQKMLPPFIGIRIKPLNDEMYRRSIRTMEIFLTTLVEKTGGALPENFVITLPKITSKDQVQALVGLLEILESKLKLPPQTLKIEFMVETPQTIFDPHGVAALPAMIHAAQGRCRGAHFGTYDYTASCNITAAHQNMVHPVCDFAKHVMQVTLAGTGITLSDGATNIMPIAPKGATPEQGRSVVHSAWNLSYQHIQHSLTNAFYQGWDLHPAQLPVRYAAVYAFFLESLDAASLRLKSFMEKAAQATLVGDVFDDAATGQGLLNYFLRGMNCGAITENEAKNTGLTIEEIQMRSFHRVLQARRTRS